MLVGYDEELSGKEYAERVRSQLNHNPKTTLRELLIGFLARRACEFTLTTTVNDEIIRLPEEFYVNYISAMRLFADLTEK